MGADGFDHRGQERFFIVEALGGVYFAGLEGEKQPECGVGDVGLARTGQSWKVGTGVADVIESRESPLQCGQLVAAGEIDGRFRFVDVSVGGQDAGKKAEVASDAIGQGNICAGDQVNGPSETALAGEKVQNHMIVWQMGCVERGACRHLCLDPGFTARGQPPRNAKQTGGMSAQENAERVVEGIGFDQRAVQIDAEGNRRDECLRRRS